MEDKENNNLPFAREGYNQETHELVFWLPNLYGRENICIRDVDGNKYQFPTLSDGSAYNTIPNLKSPSSSECRPRSCQIKNSNEGNATTYLNKVLRLEKNQLDYISPISLNNTGYFTDPFYPDIIFLNGKYYVKGSCSFSSLIG